jgi:hypothetical protein
VDSDFTGFVGFADFASSQIYRLPSPEARQLAIEPPVLTNGNSVAKDACRAEGMIKNFNTLEDFKKADRPLILKRIATTVCFTSIFCFSGYL